MDLKYRIRYDDYERKYYPERYVSRLLGLFKYWTTVPWWSTYGDGHWSSNEWGYATEQKALKAISLWRNKSPENRNQIYKEVE